MHEFRNGFDWRAWADSRIFAEDWKGNQGMRSFVYLFHPEARDFGFAPKRYCAIVGCDGIEALVPSDVVVNMELQLPKLQEGWAFGGSVLRRVGMTVLALESQHDNHEM